MLCYSFRGGCRYTSFIGQFLSGVANGYALRAQPSPAQPLMLSLASFAPLCWDHQHPSVTFFPFTKISSIINGTRLLIARTDFLAIPRRNTRHCWMIGECGVCSIGWESQKNELFCYTVQVPYKEFT